MAVTWKRLSPEKALESRDAVVSVYREVFTRAPYFENEAKVQDFAKSWDAKIATPGFRFVGAFDPHAGMVGMAFGWHSYPAGKWNARLREALGADANFWMDDCFEFGELAVKPSARGLGLGGILTEALFRSVHEKTAVLFTLQAETTALKLYERSGWETLLRDYSLGDEKKFLLMGKRLRA